MVMAKPVMVMVMVMLVTLGLLDGLVMVMHHLRMRLFRVVAMHLGIVMEAELLVHLAEASEGTAATLVQVGLVALDVKALGAHGDLLLILLEGLLHGSLMGLAGSLATLLMSLAGSMLVGPLLFLVVALLSPGPPC